MKEINYKFVDGTNKSIKVDEEFYEKYQVIEKETKSLERKETRRNVSLSIFEEKGIEFADKNSCLEEKFFEQQNIEKIQKAIKQLNKRQEDLVYQVFYLNKSLSDIAKTNGVSKSAITQQMKTIYKNLKEILKSF
ncbi:MAG: sigma factor-like helix-turn-helix DNA-binding protein [Clostridia bacterium]